MAFYFKCRLTDDTVAVYRSFLYIFWKSFLIGCAIVVAMFVIFGLASLNWDLLRFLYSHDIHNTYTRIPWVGGHGLDFFAILTHFPFHEGARKRIRDFMVVENGENISPFPEGTQTWDDFVSHFPAWGNTSESFVLLRDHPALSESVFDAEFVKMFQQIGDGPSSLLAAVVLAQYEGFLHGDTFSQYDLAMWYLSQREVVSRFTITNVLKSAGEILDFYGFRKFASQLDRVSKERLTRYGPMLVVMDYNSRYRNTGRYIVADAERAVVRNKWQGYYRKRHAVLLIGVREDDNSGHKKFLLQMWSPSQQFVEVDEWDFRSNCNATATMFCMKSVVLDKLREVTTFAGSKPHMGWLHTDTFVDLRSVDGHNRPVLEGGRKWLAHRPLSCTQ